MIEEILKDIEDFSNRWDGKDDYPGNEFEVTATIEGFDRNPFFKNILESPMIPKIEIFVHLYDDNQGGSHFTSEVYPEYVNERVYNYENPEASKQFFEITKKIHNHLVNLYNENKQ